MPDDRGGCFVATFVVVELHDDFDDVEAIEDLSSLMLDQTLLR